MKIIIIIFFCINSFCFAENIWNEAEGIYTHSKVINLEVDSNGTVYAASYLSLYRSEDGGNSWSVITLENQDFITSAILDFKCDKEDNLVIVNTNGIYILKQNSDTAKISLWATNIDKIVAVTKDNEIICSGSSGSILKLNKDKTDWTEINQTNEKYPNFNKIDVCYDEVYGIIKTVKFLWSNIDAGILAWQRTYHTTNSGKTWIQMDYLPNSKIKFQKIIVLDSNRWLYSPVGQENKLNLWNINKGEVVEIEEEKTKNLLEIFSRDNDIYLCDNRGKNLYKSTDNGHTWTQFSLDVFKNYGLNDIDAFTLDNKDNIYIGTRYKHMMKYSEEEKIWIDIDIDLESNGGIVNYFKEVNNSLYTTDNWNFIFQSSDKGKTWLRIPYPRVNYYNSFDINIKGEIIAASNSRLYYSSDLGENWIEIESNIVKLKSTGTKVKLFDDGSIFTSGGQSYYMKDINTLVSSGTLDLAIVKRLDNGNHFGLHPRRVTLVNNDFTEKSFIDRTIEDYLGYYPNLYSYAETNDGSVYLATSKGLFVAPGYIDEWEYVGFPHGVSSISIDENDYLYINTDDGLLYSKDNAKTWHQINQQPVETKYSSFLAFGNRDIVVKDSKVRYGKINENKALYIKASSEEDIWNGTDGLINIEVSSEDDVSIDSATVIIYNPWANVSDTLFTNVDGTTEYKINYHLYKSKINISHKLYFWAEKDGFQTSNIATRGIEYSYQFKVRKLYLINFPSDYIISKVDSNVSYKMRIYDANNKMVDGKFKVENSLLNETHYFEQENDLFATYEFLIPKETPLGMYKLKFSGERLDDKTVTSFLETYIVVSDTFYLINSVSEFDIKKDLFKVFPNPASDVLFVSSLESPKYINTIQLIDLKGVNVKEFHINAYMKDIKLQIDNIQNGVYFVLIKTKDKVISYPIIVE